MAKALLVVRSQVTDPSLREKFDTWYSKDHLPWAMKVFKSEKCWRFWSDTDKGAHIAVYQFADMGRLTKAMASAEFKELVADYDRTWTAGVTRTREIVTLAEEMIG